MRVHINKLSAEGDTLVTTVEGDQIRPTLQELFALPQHFVAIENDVVHSIEEAMNRLEGMEEAQVLIGKQVAGG